MILAVEAVARERRQVDAAHEGGLAVDDRDLLVVAVKRPLPLVERHPDGRALDEPVTRFPDLRTIRTEERQRRSCPGEDANLDPLGGSRQQLAQRLRAVATQPEVGREEPACDPDVRARALDRVRELGEGLGAVDVHVQTVARPRRRA